MLEINLSVFWVVGLLLLLAVILDRLVFRPVLKVIKQREDAATSARTLAEQAAEEARRAGDEFEKKTQLARAEVYRQMDDMRRSAQADRTALIEETRKEAESALAQARADLARDVDTARARLDQDAEALATDAAARILGRQPS
jgi:F-type H+-transporting ATPase subunit b